MIDIFTGEYVRSHGDQPKGNGRWGFIIANGSKSGDVFFVPSAMSFSDAKVWAKAYTRAHYGRVDLKVAA